MDTEVTLLGAYLGPKFNRNALEMLLPMKRAISATIALASVTLTFSSSIYASASPNPIKQSVNSHISQSETPQKSRVFLGQDGFKRVVTFMDSSHIDVAQLKLSLQKGDTVKILDNGRALSIYSKNGAFLFSMTSPLIQGEDGSRSGAFKYSSDTGIATVYDPQTTASAISQRCASSEVAKWSYRVGAGLLCGGVGGMNPVAGMACGLAASGGEDHIPFNNAY